MKITRITIGRLHNLGNYEHIRYELTAEVADGEAPTVAMIGMERILEALNPKCPHSTKGEIQRERIKLETAHDMTNEEFACSFGHEGISYKGTRAEYMGRMAVALIDEETKRTLWDARQAKARKLLEDLGGAANWKDHKLDWEDESYPSDL